MSWSSTTPAALSALLAAFRAAPGLAGADIRDGPQVTASDATEAVIVGWYGQASDQLAVTATETPEVFGGEADRERYAIRCAAMVLSGDQDITAARTRAYVLLAACGSAVAADRTLAGTVMEAWAGSHSLRQEQGTKGAVATVEFAVECDAFTGS